LGSDARLKNTVCFGGGGGGGHERDTGANQGYKTCFFEI